MRRQTRRLLLSDGFEGPGKLVRFAGFASGTSKGPDESAFSKFESTAGNTPGQTNGSGIGCGEWYQPTIRPVHAIAPGTCCRLQRLGLSSAGMFVPSGGFLLNSVDFGSGRRTFVAHGGWVGSWELWQEPFQLMQHSWRCISYDHRGSGASTCPAEQITPQGLVDDLFRVLDHYGVDRCVLAGESLGALTCLQAAIAHPDRFDGLVLVDGAPAADRARQAALVVGARTNFPATVKAFVDACVPEPDSEHLRRWGRQILLRADPEAAARMLEVHYEAEIAPNLASVTVPTLVVHGRQDVIVPVSVADYVAREIPRATKVIIPDAGHVPSVTRPLALVTAIQEWAQLL